MDLKRLVVWDVGVCVLKKSLRQSFRSFQGTERAGFGLDMTMTRQRQLLVVIVIIGCTLAAFLANGNLDTLCSKAFAEFRAVADARKLLCRVDLELIAEDRCPNGEFVHLAWSICFQVRWRLDVDEGKS